jgi:histone-lysine N-methyltransferase SETD2
MTAGVGLTARTNGRRSITYAGDIRPTDALFSPYSSFQQKEYADLEIVLTPKKGYGLRAERDLQTCV